MDGMKKHTIELFQIVRCSCLQIIRPLLLIAFHSDAASMPPRYYAMAARHILLTGQRLNPATTDRR